MRRQASCYPIQIHAVLASHSYLSCCAPIQIPRHSYTSQNCRLALPSFPSEYSFPDYPGYHKRRDLPPQQPNSKQEQFNILCRGDLLAQTWVFFLLEASTLQIQQIPTPPTADH